MMRIASPVRRPRDATWPAGSTSTTVSATERRALALDVSSDLTA